jgi:hypothetical protein
MDTAFEIMANDLMSVMKKSNAGDGMLQWLFGMGPQMSTSTNPMTDIKSVLGMGGSSAAASPLISAGATLTSAGTTLGISGSGLNSAATALLSAATSLQVTGAAGGSSSIPGLSVGGGWLGDSIGSGAGTGLSAGSDASSGSAGWSSSLDGMPSDISSGSISSQASGLGGAGNKYLGAAGGALTAGMGIYSAFENSNPLSGAISGAMGGAEIGSMFVPAGMAIGAVVGGVAGLVAGIFGDKGAGKAKDYDHGTIIPNITKEMQDYDAGRSGYNTASKDLNDLIISSRSQTNAWGMGSFGQPARG